MLVKLLDWGESNAAYVTGWEYIPEYGARYGNWAVASAIVGRGWGITDAVLSAAADNRSNGKEVMEMLLATDPNIETTEAVLTTAAWNRQGAGEVIKTLLARGTRIKITVAVFVRAEQLEWQGRY